MKWAAIFDMDGVVADTNALHQRAWRAFCREHGRDLSEEDLERHVYGRTNPEIMRYLLPGLDAAQMDQLARDKERMFQESAKGSLEAVAGLPELLRALDARGVALALATSAPMDNVDLVLAETGLTGMFQVIVEGPAVKRSKPAPDIFLLAAERLAMAPARCLVFEDSLSGIQAAVNASMAVVGVATTHSVDELAPLAALAIPDFRGLTPERLAALLPGAA